MNIDLIALALLPSITHDKSQIFLRGIPFLLAAIWLYIVGSLVIYQAVKRYAPRDVLTVSLAGGGYTIGAYIFLLALNYLELWTAPARWFDVLRVAMAIVTSISIPLLALYIKRQIKSGRRRGVL